MGTLTLGQAIRNAIEAERAASRFYSDLAARAEDPLTRRFFEEMIRVEQHHSSEIEDIGHKLVDGSLGLSGAGQITVVEPAPDWTHPDDLGIDQGLQLAFECESRAARYYAALAEGFPGPGAGFFRMLAHTEEQHARLVHSELEGRQAARATTMTLGQAVRNAIQAERSSADFYRKAASRTSDSAARKFFEDMIGVEHLHAGEIERLSRSLHQGPLAERANVPVDIVETAPVWDYDEELDIDGALHVALEAEKHAALYYGVVAGYFEGRDEEFFRELARTEEEHARMITSTIQKRSLARN